MNPTESSISANGSPLPLWKRPLFLRIAAILTLTILAYVFFAVKVHWGKPQTLSSEDVKALLQGETITIDFTAERNHLEEVRLISYWQSLPRYGTDGLLKASFTLQALAEQTPISTQESFFTNKTFTAQMLFPRQHQSQGKSYRLKIRLTNLPDKVPIPQTTNVTITAGYIHPSAAPVGAGCTLLLLLAVWLLEVLLPKPAPRPPRPKGDKKLFDSGMHYFRGFAITGIVLGHSARLQGSSTWPRTSL